MTDLKPPPLDRAPSADPLEPPQRHRAKAELKLGGFCAKAKIDIGTRGLLAVTGLVGVILGGTAAIVWAATGPGRRRAALGRSPWRG
jgi:hypothetical protein